MRTHADRIRGSRHVPLSPISEGRFGRMFRRLPPAPPLTDDQLRALADSMREAEEGGGTGGWGPVPQGADNPMIPAGYTYLGQFIDHDITFDPISSLDQANDPDALHDFRTPRFDLDSVYGSGPADEPFQYENTNPPLKLLVGRNPHGDEDLPRNNDGIALIGDPRNDENTIVGQLQLLWIKLHNKLADGVASEGTLAPDLQFAEAQRRTRWVYQRMIVDDFLPRTCGQGLMAQLWKTPKNGPPDIDLRYYRPRTKPYMPVEFSVAAYRFGHSQVRGIYNLSSLVTDRPIFIPGPLPNEFADLRGFRPLPQQWTVEWPLFFQVDGSSPQLSRRIDAKLAAGLFNLPDEQGDLMSLAFRNLKRGQALGLPSGQDVARAVRAPQVLSGADMGAPEPTPLWFYVLKEAELLGDGGQRLGPTGGRIVAEVLLGMLRGDAQSFYSQQPEWTATELIPDADGDGKTGMGDIVKFLTA
jgi:hypothetical protein